MSHIASYIDHTLLKADATQQMIDQLIEEARQYSFASVCVNPYWVKYCYDILKETEVSVCTVIGFPLGAQTTEGKVFEAKQAIQYGATEIDMVINIGSLKSRDYETVKHDMHAIVQVSQGKALVKAIIETSLLTDQEKVSACKLAKQAGVDFVKTSTGFTSSGATKSDVQLMRNIVGNEIGVKASGGVRTLKDAQAMIEAGATRIGTSAGVSIIKEGLEQSL